MGKNGVFVSLALLAILIYSSTAAYVPDLVCLGEGITSILHYFGMLSAVFLVFALSFIISIFSVGMTKWRWWVKGPLVVTVAVALIVGSFMAIFRARDLARDFAIRRAIERAQPILSALADYNSREGKYPESLESAGIASPSTGICLFNEFRYELSKPDSTSVKELAEKSSKGEAMTINSGSGSTGGFELQVDMPIGFMNWDVLVYWPSQKYPEDMKGGLTEAFDNWVYVHE